MNFRLFIFFPFLMVRRAAHGAARIAAVLAKGAVRAWILLRRLLIHASILQPSTAKKLISCNLSGSWEARKAEVLPFPLEPLAPGFWRLPHYGTLELRNFCTFEEMHFFKTELVFFCIIDTRWLCKNHMNI